MSSLTAVESTRKELSSNVTLVEDFDESRILVKYSGISSKITKSVNILYNKKLI